MALAALGVVYGDIGTSPLYALRECFHLLNGLSVTLPTISGLLIGTVGMVVLFGTFSNLAAYRIAVAGTMVITTLLIFIVARLQWKWGWPTVVLITGSFLVMDLSFTALMC